MAIVARGLCRNLDAPLSLVLFGWGLGGYEVVPTYIFAQNRVNVSSYNQSRMTLSIGPNKTKVSSVDLSKQKLVFSLVKQNAPSLDSSPTTVTVPPIKTEASISRDSQMVTDKEQRINVN